MFLLASSLGGFFKIRMNNIMQANFLKMEKLEYDELTPSLVISGLH